MKSISTTMISTDRPRDVSLLVLLLVFALGMSLRLYQLDADSLWRDEIETATISALEVSSMLEPLARGGTLPPLLYIITHFFIRLSGASEFVLRLPAALLGSASVLLIYKLGALLWTRTEGLAAAFLLAVNPWHIRYSQEARQYSLMVFLTVLSLVFLLRALQGNHSKSWIGFALVTSLAIYNHYFAFLVVLSEVAFAAWVIWSNRSSREQALASNALDSSGRTPFDQEASLFRPMEADLSHQQAPRNARTQALCLAGSLLLVAVSYVPWLPAIRSQFLYPDIGYRGIGVATRQSIDLALQFYRDLFVAHSGGDGIALVLCLVLLGVGLARGKREHWLLAVLWAAPPFLFISLVDTRHWYHARYGVHILPVHLLFVAAGLAGMGHCLMKHSPTRIAPRAWSLGAMISLAMLVGLVQAPSLRAYYLEQKEDWRSVGRYLASHLQPGDAIVADGLEYRTGRDDVRLATCLPYYLNAYGIENAPVLLLRNRLWLELRDLDDWSGQLWGVVHHRDELTEVDEVQVVDFHEVSIIHLNRPSGRMLQDTEDTLQALLGIIPEGEARFDIHLALADIYMRSGQLGRAESQLLEAGGVKPDGQQASDSLEVQQARSERLSSLLEAMSHPLWRNIGEVVALLGYDVQHETVQPGDTVELTLWWRQLECMDRDYTAFIHVVDSDDLVWAQEDALLGRSAHPTSTWGVSEISRDQHELLLPADIPQGQYAIKVGVYYWVTGERLPMWDEEGQRSPDDAALVHRITVVAPSD